MQHANALKVLFALLINGTGAFCCSRSRGRSTPGGGALMAVASLVGGLARRARGAAAPAARACARFAIAVGLFAAGKFLLRAG